MKKLFFIFSILVLGLSANAANTMNIPAILNSISVNLTPNTNSNERPATLNDGNDIVNNDDDVTGCCFATFCGNSVISGCVSASSEGDCAQKSLAMIDLVACFCAD